MKRAYSILGGAGTSILIRPRKRWFQGREVAVIFHTTDFGTDTVKLRISVGVRASAAHPYRSVGVGAKEDVRGR